MSTAPVPHWGATRGWAGFVLVLVPMPGLRTDVAELCRRAAEHVAGDPTMGETVAVGLGPEVGGAAAGQPSAVARALVRAAMQPGYLLAPTVVFGILLIGAEQERTDQIADWLAGTAALQRFRVHQFSLFEEPGEVTVTDVLNTVDGLRGQYDQWPTASLPENQFLAAVSGRPVAAAPAESAARSSSPTPASTPEHDDSSEESSRAGDDYPEEDLYRADEQTADDEPEEARTEVLRAVWSGAVGRVRGLLPQQAPTESESMDRLARRSGGVSLVYIVLAPDVSPMPRSTRNRRRDLVLEVDAAFARRRVDAGASFEVSVLAGDRTLTRQTALQSAGGLGKRAMPKVGVGYFDLAAGVDDLLEIRDRDIASLRRRATAVTGTYVVLFSTHAPLADIDAVERFEKLCEQARVTWILVDADTDLLSEEFSTVQGAEILEDHPDVVSALMATAFATAEVSGDADQDGEPPEAAAEDSPAAASP